MEHAVAQADELRHGCRGGKHVEHTATGDPAGRVRKRFDRYHAGTVPKRPTVRKM